jgi:hypothetical protein
VFLVSLSNRRNEVTTLRTVWHVLVGLIYLGVVIAVLSTATTTFETLVLAGIVQVYAAVLYNFSILGTTIDANNYAGLIRFRVLAAAQGVSDTEEGPIGNQEEALGAALKANERTVLIQRISHSAVSIYVLFKIVWTLISA